MLSFDKTTLQTNVLRVKILLISLNKYCYWYLAALLSVFREVSKNHNITTLVPFSLMQWNLFANSIHRKYFCLWKCPRASKKKLVEINFCRIITMNEENDKRWQKSNSCLEICDYLLNTKSFHENLRITSYRYALVLFE